MKTIITAVIALMLLPGTGCAESWAERNVREHDAWIAREIATTNQSRTEREAEAIKMSAELKAWEKSGRPLKCFYVVCGGAK